MRVVTPAGTATARGVWMRVGYDPARGVVEGVQMAAAAGLSLFVGQ